MLVAVDNDSEAGVVSSYSLVGPNPLRESSSVDLYNRQQACDDHTWAANKIN